MNETRMEELLRNPPRVVVPAGLGERLKAQIRLPSEVTNEASWLDSGSWLRRWLPAMAVAAFFLGCFMVAGVQSSMISGLQRDNAGLRAKAQNLDQLRATNADLERLKAQLQELDRLHRDNEELIRLRLEADQLRDQVQDAENLRAEAMKRLAAEIAARKAETAAASNQVDPQIVKAQLASCVNNLKQIGLGARTWDIDHNGMEPSNYVSMSNELWIPRILICPSDRSHTAAKDWDHLTAENISYPIVSPGILETWPAAVYAYCPIHHAYLLADGSVQVLTPEQEKTEIKVVNGITMYVP